MLAETIDGATIASQAVEEKFNPASSVKLATSFAALQAFGPEHRFVTAVWRTGTLDPATGTVNGDLIITGGANVYPAEVEAALAEHPGIADLAVIGIPDEEWGHRIGAVAVPRRGHDVTGEELRDHLPTQRGHR